MHTILKKTWPIAVFAIFSTLTPLAGCGKGDKPKKVKNLFSERPPKIDYSQIKVDKPKLTPTAVKADTWASHTRDFIAGMHTDLQTCRNEFMLPFQFKKMRRRNVEWLKINRMDTVCRDGDRAAKQRGVWSKVQYLANEQLGKQPELDRFIMLAVDHIEHARIVSLMAKKIGAPKIELITDTAKEARDRVLENGMQLDREAAAIAAWKDDNKALDDPTVVAQTIDLAGFKQLLDSRYTWFMADCLGQYDRSAQESWQYPNMVKIRGLKLWPEIIEKYLSQDRARIDKVTDGDERAKADLMAYLDAAQGVVKAWKDSYERYLAKKDPDQAWVDVDPFRVPLAKALVGWATAHDKLFGTKKAAAQKATNKGWAKVDRARRKAAGARIIRPPKGK